MRTFFFSLREEKPMRNRFYAIILQEVYILKNSLETIFDIFLLPTINVVIFGYLSLYLTGSNNQAAIFLLSGMLLWQIVFITQYSISIGSLWNIWSRNMSNIFMTPISVREYFTALIFSSLIKAFLLFTLLSLMSILFFSYNILTSLTPLVLLITFINLCMSGISLGILMVGLIFRYGTKIQALAWGLIFLFQPFTANLFPVSILPSPIKELAFLLPPTYIFENSRQVISTGQINWNLIGYASLLNLVYLIISFVSFAYNFKKAKQTGQFARNES